MERIGSFYRIGKTYISETSPEDTLEKIKYLVDAGKKGHICVSNVRTTELAYQDEKYRDLMDNTLMNLPDGMPLVWMARLWGLKEVERTVGPELFKRMLSNPDPHIKHFLLGDTQETLDSLKNLYPNGNIVGSFSPPFCELKDYDYKQIGEMIKDSGANIVWLALRAPKQDYFGMNLIPYLDHQVTIGVGAAFRFAKGEYKDPPKIIKKLGLTGFYWRKNKWHTFIWAIQNSFRLLLWGSDIILSRFLKNESFDPSKSKL